MKLTLLLLIILTFTCHNLSFGQKYYLSPEGNYGNQGTRVRPLAMLTRTRDRVREYRKNNIIIQQVEIIPLAGEYFLFQALLFTDEDSGASDSTLIIKPEEGACFEMRAGVYGLDEWRKPAGFDPHLAKEFDNVVMLRESLK